MALSKIPPGWTLREWRTAYTSGRFSPQTILTKLLQAMDPSDPLWISLINGEELTRQLKDLGKKLQAAHGKIEAFPLYGVPFVVKDNIDAEGLKTTAGCEAFAFAPAKDAPVVARLKAAGAVLFGKTNMDQFATGLVGTRSPYGVVPNAFDSRYVSGGSSSGSAVAVANGWVPFSLGTDTAGSGRVPAAFNNIVGLKPTRGALSTRGVVPTCRSLDCVSVLALTVEDAEAVIRIVQDYDDQDVYSRVVPAFSAVRRFGPRQRFGIPAEPKFFGDRRHVKAYERSLNKLRDMDIELQSIDFTPMHEMADLLYEGPWVAERLAAFETLLTTQPEAVHPIVREIIMQGQNFSAMDTFKAEYRRVALARIIQAVFNDVDALLVPSTPNFPTLRDVEADPIRANSRLGTYTNFVNLADCCALALPAGFREDGLPFGFTLVAPAWHDAVLVEFGGRWQKHCPWPLGATKRAMPRVSEIQPITIATDNVRLAVVGAHLSGMPLNHQLTERGASFVENAQTAPYYRLYALSGTVPPKPGLIRVEKGASLQVEVWDMPLAHFGSFVELVPAPLGIGTLTLLDGREVKGFICEGLAVESARDISDYGGWRAFVADEKRKKNNPSPLGGPFRKVLIANRGEIAVRIARTLKAMGIQSVAVYSDADRNSPHVAATDEAVALGGNTAAESYLRAELILEAARKSNAQAIIPGYGFLSENADFAERCEAAGIIFIGPTPDQMRRFGLKHISREIARQAGVPLIPGTGLLDSLDEAKSAARRIGYPVMLKSTAGGGGIGLAKCDGEKALVSAFESVRRLGENYFGDSGVFLERFVYQARHVEVQIFGDGMGHVITLGERDCSLQRRNQKVVEETPAPRLPPGTRARLLESAVRLGEAVQYRSAGTIEYIYDGIRDEFYFLEVNTRLQVEHPVTESVTGIDLVEWMIRLAAGDCPPLDQPIALRGASMEVRLYAENPARDFQPSPGVITEVHFPKNVRVDTWIAAGTEVSPYYDPMIAKLIVFGKDRDEALFKLRQALAHTRIAGINTNLDYLRQVVGSTFFQQGKVSTVKLSLFPYKPPVVEVLQPGTYTTVQDYPGRVGYWDIGVPPSGPMDDYAFRLANRIVGNHPSAAGLECTIIGPKLKFHRDAVIALTGAPSPATLDGSRVKFWTPLKVKVGQILDCGKAETGCRTYLAVRNGFDVPLYLGSRATFVLGQFGGHYGRILRASDMLQVNQPGLPACTTPAAVHRPQAAPAKMIPHYPVDWEIGVLYGPHGAPDFFTEISVDVLFNTHWQVHYNSNRLGIRLNGPKPYWTRSDGGEAGLHPSNIHDTEYAVGSINFTGDMPVILTQDGPSLGGFVCPITIAKAELWKVGQVKPGDRILFKHIDFAQALAMEKSTDKAIEKLPVGIAAELYLPLTAKRRKSLKASKKVPTPSRKLSKTKTTVSECVLADLPPRGSHPEVAYRQAGDKYILVEYGPHVLDLRLRFRVHALMEALRKNPVLGILELSPGVRSLQVHYDSRVIPQPKLLEALLKAEESLSAIDSMRVPSRVVHLPMAFEDSATLEAVARYRKSVRDTAPWLPSNTEFIRRINGLESVEQVRKILFQTSYMVLGLGDVYLGAPCAVPVDPRHRLLTSKYNPARTYTAEGTVGIGGVYMCIYGMDSPGGYQLVGRTLPIWNKFLKNFSFVGGKNWLLRFFDQVRFYPVSEEELTVQREAFREGRVNVKIEEEIFDLAVYERFLVDNADSIERFQKRQKASFETEVKRWQENQVADSEILKVKFEVPEEIDGLAIRAVISGNVWKLQVELGQKVQRDQVLVILEAMKMEFSVGADSAGTINAIYCKSGTQVNAGDLLMVIKPD